MTTKMNPQLKERWLTALRSGEYKQGRECLRCSDGDKYCCLGVLADVYNPSLWIGVTCCGYEYGYLMESATDSLPDKVAQTVGLDTDTQVELIKMNDDDGKSFLEIADHIEINL